MLLSQTPEARETQCRLLEVFTEIVSARTCCGCQRRHPWSADDLSTGKCNPTLNSSLLDQLLRGDLVGSMPINTQRDHTELARNSRQVLAPYNNPRLNQNKSMRSQCTLIVPIKNLTRGVPMVVRYSKRRSKN